MKKLLFVAQNMAVGGIQTSLVNLMDEICARGEHEVHLFTFAPGALLDQVPEQVSVTCGGKLLRLSATPFGQVLRSANIVDIVLRMWLILWAQMRGSRRVYERLLRRYQRDEGYDIAVSYFNDIPVGYFNKGTNQYVSDYVCAEQKVAWFHTDPVAGKFDPAYCRELYKQFHKIVCVSQAVKSRFDAFLPELADRTVVFHNRFPEAKIRMLAQEYEPFAKDRYHVVTVARVDNASKRIDEMVRLCHRLKTDGVIGFCWHIVGDGPDRAANETLAKKLGVSDLICFEGEKKNPYPYIKCADLFALCSAYEGFPMVVGEAQVLGTPVLTTNYAAAQEQIAPEQGMIAKTNEIFYQELKSKILRFLAER